MKEDINVKYNTILLNTFPDLKEKFDEETSWQQGIESPIMSTFEDVFVPYIVKQLADNNVENIKKIADIIEDMITSGNDDVFNVAYVGVLEYLRGDQDGQKIEGYLKEKSLAEYNDLEIYKKH